MMDKCSEALEREKALHLQVGMADKDELSYYAAALCAFLLLALLFVITKRVYMVYMDRFLHNFHNNYVFLTGCDSGFGRETALRLDSLGFNVFATCLTSKGQEDLSAVCSNRLRAIHLDVTDSHQIREAYKFVAHSLPADTGLWGLINNAGIAKVGPVEWQTLADYKQVADVNLWGLIDVTKVFLPLIKKGRGRIVNIASIGGRCSLPHASAYSISKYGVEAFSDALRRELSPTGVKVSIVEPGFFHTNITNKNNLRALWEGVWTELDSSLKEDYGETFYQTSVKNMLKGMVDTCASPHLYKVVDSIVHALASQHPKTRYVVGWDAKLLWIWVSRLPASIGDALLNFLGDKAEPSQCRRLVSEKTGYTSLKLNANNNAENGFVLYK